MVTKFTHMAGVGAWGLYDLSAKDMSYRDLRNICEVTRALGYPRILSIENFRTPNFPLVAELLQWIIKRFEPNAILPTGIDTEQQRVLFIKSCVLLLLQNVRIKLNPKKLYQADGYAVQELMIALRILYKAANTEVVEDNTLWNQARAKMNQRMQEVRAAGHLAQQLPQTGSLLHDLLGKELFFRKQRIRATSRAISVQDAEKSIQAAAAAVQQEAKETAEKLNNVADDEKALDEKIERRNREFEQLQKRFAKLQSFRPQYMDEYEKYEAKLKKLYEIYVLQFRNLSYLQLLQVEMERSDRQKQEETERNMRQIVEKMRSEQKEHAPPIDIGELDDEEPEQRPEGARKVFGNMLGAGLSDDEDEEDEEYVNGEGDEVLLQSDVSEEEHVEVEREIEEMPIRQIALKSEDDEYEEEKRLSSGDDF